ncbi:MAG: hypothetical protein H6582_04445 [Crocinitomicaceae bacterium]|nr:hypothetical protein [Crocinitomicaceae bacterium]
MICYQLISCNADHEDVACCDEEIDLIAVDDEDDWSYPDDIILVDILNVEGKISTKILSPEHNLYRRVNIPQLSFDTLCWIFDYSLWNYPDSTVITDSKYQYEIKIAFSDIDTNNFNISMSDSLIWIQINGLDTNKATWSKYMKQNDYWDQLWSVKSTSISFPYLSSLVLIKDNYSSYHMYLPEEYGGVRADYCTSDLDSIQSWKIANSAIEIIKRCVYLRGEKPQ